MTLYYPQGLYGPICDIQPAAEVEFIAREVVLEEPNITLGTQEEDTGGGNGGAEGQIGGAGGAGGLTITIGNRISPKICRTVQVRNLFTGDRYGDGYGPICDVPNLSYGDSGDSGNSGENVLTELCPDDNIDAIDVLYNPLPDNGIANLNLDVPLLRCEVHEIDVELPDGTTNIIKYFRNCRPVVGDYEGPVPSDTGLQTQPVKVPITYNYYHSLICGALDYYSSPGIYENSIPNGIDAVSIIVFGAGGGAGGGDQAAGPTGSGNNSGGTGSFMYLNVNLDRTVRNNLTIVIGGGGVAGRSYVNRPKETLPGYNRGGYGGYPGPKGVSGAGGSGGGATDVYLNGRLIASCAGGGGGGGNGCNYFRGTVGKPWGNWDNYVWDENLESTSDALIRSRFPNLMAKNVFEPPVKHSLWSSWFNEYVVWFNYGEDNHAGQELENRVNLNFDTSGTYTFEMQADNQMAVYIAPWYDPGEGSYISDILYNGTFDKFIGDELMSDNTGFLTPPSTLPADISEAQDWTLIGWTSEFTAATPDTATYTISTPGRYVLRLVVGNDTNATSDNDWQKNPAGFALNIKKPDNSVLWSTREAYGSDGQSFTVDADGGGAGGGGGNSGAGGLTADGMGLTGGSCSDRDSTGQGGSAGWSYVLDHPAITLDYFDQADGGFHSGWNTPTTVDSSIRKAGGGFGGGRPQRFTFIFDNVEYPLYTNAGSSKELIIPGMGTGVWQDFMNGRTFQYHYFWGVTKDGSPETAPSGLTDGSLGYLFFGSYQGETNSVASERASLYRGRSLELALQWTPIKTGSTWSTKVRLVGIAPWGQGTGFAENDILPGVFPPTKSDGTQPWWDIITAGSDSWHVLEFTDPSDKVVKPATIPGTSFNFSIRVDEVRARDEYKPSDGQHGFARTQYLSVDTVINLAE